MNRDSSAQAPTELLLNFSIQTVRRRIGDLKSKSKTPVYLKARATSISNADRSMGGEWWHDPALSSALESDHEVLKRYRERLRERIGSGWGWCSVPVRPRLRGSVLYFLLHVSRHSAGHWKFNTALSLAMQEYFSHCRGDQPELFELEEEIEEALVGHLKTLLLEKKRITLGANLQATFGRAFGLAREKHLRAAIKRLYAEGLSGFNGVGKLYLAELGPPK